MRKILSLVMALAMLCGMFTFASADEVVTLEWYVLEGPAPGNQMVWDAINEYMVEKIGVKINFHYINTMQNANCTSIRQTTKTCWKSII